MEHNITNDGNGQDKLLRHKKCIVFHEAGHAAGIHLNNQANQLPSVFFKIMLNTSGDAESGDMAYQSNDDNCIARVEGGRLIEPLPTSMASLGSESTKYKELLTDYQLAFDTDIINLLIGPLAEAKYVAENDNEPFNHQLIHLKALGNYGGGADLAIVDDYLQSLPINQQQKTEKLSALFLAAFKFVTNEANWDAITKLANYILGSKKTVICREEVVSILEQSIGHFQNRKILLLGF
jgi:hypothetical protein